MNTVQKILSSKFKKTIKEYKEAPIGSIKISYESIIV